MSPRSSLTLGRALAIAVLGSAAVMLSCQILLGLDEPEGVPRPDDAGIDVIDPCKHAHPPEPPAVDDDPLREESYWFATERVLFPLRPDSGVQPGFDLDNACTCQSDLRDGAPPCLTPVPNESTSCDFDGGVDDALSKILIEDVAPVPNFDPSEPVNRELRNGKRNFLMHLSKYNGRANDLDVRVAFVASGGLYDTRGCEDKERDAGPRLNPLDAGTPGPQHAPLWDGCDRWSPNDGITVGQYPNRVPGTAVTTGYVRNYNVVVRIDGVTLEILSASAKAGNAIIMIRLIPIEGGSNLRFRTEGIVSGRLAFSDLVGVLGRTEITVGQGKSEVLCTQPIWANVSPLFCAARDTMQSPPLEHSNQVCDAVTASLGLIGRQAQVSDLEYSNPGTSGVCPDASVACPFDAGRSNPRAGARP